ncbi:unnamed protein product, partial [Polarella glacialis]
VTAATCTCAAGLYVADRDAFDTAQRFRRTAALSAWMLADYSWHLRLHPPDSTTREDALEDCHRRNAPLLRNLCFQNGGIYIKIGQLLGIMDNLLPKAYVEELQACFDACPRSTSADVERVILEDLGKRPLELFETFEQEPVASASLAQVHRATLPGGKQLAVKVQHRPLLRLARTEMAGIDLVLRCVRLIEPRFGFQWLAEEVRESLPKELDFRLEAQNAARCRKVMAAAGLSSAVVVPETHAPLSSTRVLVMDFEEGQSLASNAAAMRAEGVQPHSVVRRFSEAYAEMAFGEGFLHCDPHPGNVLWRRSQDAPGGFQLVLLDHGLYREIPRDLRLAYCELWRAIALGDGDAAVMATRKLGVRSTWLAEKIAAERASGGEGHLASGEGAPTNEDAEVLAGKMLTSMLSGRSFRAVADGRGGLMRFDRDFRGKSADDDRAEIGGYVVGYFNGILDVLDTLPRAMILLLKANDCLRATASRLDVPTSVPLAVSCSACCRALRRAGDKWQWSTWWLSVRCWLFLRLEGSMWSRLL